MWHKTFSINLTPLLTVLSVAMLLFIPSLSTARTDVGGEEWGEWTSEGNPYYVLSTVIIPEDRELFIREGVDVTFTNHYSIEVYGTLIANGGNVGDDRIWFEGDNDGNNGTTWNGIYFRREGDHVSSLTNCDFFDVWAAVSCYRNSPQIVGNNISALNVAIYCSGASPVIEENSISVSGDDTSQEVIGINLRGGSAPRIVRNKMIEVQSIANGAATGILIRESDPLIKENWIDISSETGAVYGISAHRTDKLSIKHNIIRLNSQGSIKGLWTIESSDVKFLNNDVILEGSSQNATGLVIGEGSQVSVVNNIVVGNGFSSIGINSRAGEVQDSSDYNDFWNHDVNYVGGWQGQNDIDADPLFIVEDGITTYRLPWPNFPDINDEGRSPCIDAGNPRLFDEDGSRSDMGRYAYLQAEKIDKNVLLSPESFRILSAYPNPFNSTTTIGFELNKAGVINFTLYDSQGRLLETLRSGFTQSGAHSFLWNAADYPSGQYLLQLSSSSNRKSQTLILVR